MRAPLPAAMGYSPQSQPPLQRRFPSSSTWSLCAVDEYLSGCLAAVRLPWLTHLLAPFAHACGAPLISLVMIPACMGVLAPSPHEAGVADARVAVCAAALALCVGLPCLRSPNADTFRKGAHIPGGCAASLVAVATVSPNGFQAACLYLFGWVHVLLLIWT